MIDLLFSKKQNEIFKKQFEDFNEDIVVWNITNFFVPAFIILIPLFFYYFLPEEKATFNNLILNGSFSLLGINILFSMSIFLINSVRIKNAKMEQDIISIRKKLITYLSLLLIFGSSIYWLQIMHDINSSGKTFTVLFFGFLLFYFSIGIGKRIFIIRDELIGKPIEDDVRDKVEDLKDSLKDLD
jgi:hypothetical protein